MSLIARFRRYKKPSPKAVADFARVTRDQDLPLDSDRNERLAKLLSGDEDPVVNFDEIADLLGQSSGKTQR